MSGLRTSASRWWVAKRRLRERPPPLASVLESFGRSEDVSDEPVFLLAAGWRTGSTLLQRLVVSSGEVLVWGEPYTFMNPVQTLSGMVQMRGVMPQQWFLDDQQSVADLSDRFIANLYPPADALLEANRAFHRELFGEPAARYGFARWGVKEVRWDVDHARYLKALFPRSRIVMLVRDPYAAFASYHGHLWYGEWPESVRTPRQFGSHWSALARGFLEGADELDALLIRYEDLVADPATLDRLDEHLGITMDRDVLDRTIGSSARRVDRGMHRSMSRWVEPVASEFGY